MVNDDRKGARRERFETRRLSKLASLPYKHWFPGFDDPEEFQRRQTSFSDTKTALFNKTRLLILAEMMEHKVRPEYML